MASPVSCGDPVAFGESIGARLCPVSVFFCYLQGKRDVLWTRSSLLTSLSIGTSMAALQQEGAALIDDARPAPENGLYSCRTRSLRSCAICELRASDARVTKAAAQSTVPVLRYTPPANTYQSAMAPPDDYAFNGFNASVQIYPFRPFTGDIQQAFQMTLLRDWIAPQHQEENVGAPPAFATVAVPGADLTMVANFVENIVGLPRPHTRMLIIVGNQAAIV